MVAITSTKAGSLAIQAGTLPIRYYDNLKTVRVEGFNPFLPDGTTTNPYASVCILADERYIIKDVFLNNMTIAGVAPTTLAGALASINTLLAE